VESLRRSYVTLRVGGNDFPIAWSTQRELLKLLQRAPGTLNVILHFENIGANRPIELDRDGNAHVYHALRHWAERPPLGLPLPDEARALLAALASERTPEPPRAEAPTAARRPRQRRLRPRRTQ
jgi:hypothetical protein